jgi:hypothetical protein
MKKKILTGSVTKIALLMVVIFVTSSCMTIYSYKDYDASFYTDVVNTSVSINNSVSQPIPSNITLKHSTKKLNVKVLQNDSIINEILIKPRLRSMVFWGNAYIWGIPGMIIDVATGRGLSYGNYFTVDSLGKVISLRRPTKYMSENMSINTFRQNQKRNFNILFTIPEINIFHLKPVNETSKNLAGFMGLGIGAEYFYKNNKSLQLRGDAIMDFFIPFPAAVDFDDSYPRESCNAFNVYLTDNFYIKRFQLGYGINFAKNTWVYSGYFKKPFYELEENEKPEWIPGKTKTNRMLGLALNTYYRFTEHFYFGVIYRPSFLELSKSKLMYEHSISFDFLWKIHL